MFVVFVSYFFLNVDNDSTKVTVKCHLWGKCETEPDVHYEGGELRVFDHVEVTGISLFEMDRMLESQDRELHVYCVNQFEYGRVVDLYTEVSFSELLAS